MRIVRPIRAVASAGLGTGAVVAETTPNGCGIGDENGVAVVIYDSGNSTLDRTFWLIVTSP